MMENVTIWNHELSHTLGYEVDLNMNFQDGIITVPLVG